MNKANPILKLAKRARRGNLSRRKLKHASLKLWQHHDVGRHLQEAVEGIRGRRYPPVILELVCRIGVFLVLKSKKQMLAGSIHGEAGYALKSHPDPRCLRLAAKHYRKARRYYTRDDPHYAIALIQEAEAYCRLADLGIDQIENPNTAILLCAEAWALFDPESDLYAETMMIMGAAHVFLAQAEVAPQTNIHAGVRLCRDARLLYDICQPESDNCGAARTHEAKARHLAAEFGIDVRTNLADCPR